MDLLKDFLNRQDPRSRPRSIPAWAAAGFGLACLCASCNREFENPFLPDSEGYAGTAWSRDRDGDGVADSVEKYAPGCGSGPVECLRKAQANAGGGGALRLDSVAVEDLNLVEGGPPLAPRFRCFPPGITGVTYSLASDNPTVAEPRDSLVSPGTEGSAILTLNARNGTGVTRSATFRANVTRTRIAVASISAADMQLAPGESKTPEVDILPADATDTRYELLTHDPGVAVVSQGMLTGVAPGQTLVTARSLDGDRQALFRVTVEAVKVAVRSVRVADMSFTVLTARIREPTVTWVPANATDRAYTLESQDPGIAKVVDGSIEAMRSGETKVTLTTRDGARQDSFKVKVSALVGCGGVLDPCDDDKGKGKD